MVNSQEVTHTWNTFWISWNTKKVWVFWKAWNCVPLIFERESLKSEPSISEFHLESNTMASESIIHIFYPFYQHDNLIRYWRCNTFFWCMIQYRKIFSWNHGIALFQVQFSWLSTFSNTSYKFQYTLKSYFEELQKKKNCGKMIRFWKTTDYFFCSCN